MLGGFSFGEADPFESGFLFFLIFLGDFSIFFRFFGRFFDCWDIRSITMGLLGHFFLGFLSNSKFLAQ